MQISVMKRNVRPRGPRVGRSKRGHQDSRQEYVKDIELDTSQGLTGVFHQVSQAICKPSNSSKSRDICLAYINNAVNYISKTSNRNETKDINTHITPTEKDVYEIANVDVSHKEGYVEDWDDCSIKEKYFCLFRCALLHKRKEVRVAGLRLLRYILKTEEDVKSLIKSNSIPLIIRCIDICIDNHNERVHGVRLARHMMQIAPLAFPISLARCLIAIAKDGAKERDKLLRSAQAIVNELAILNPHVFVDCGGVSCTLYGILDCHLARVNEALMSGLLFLLNDPKWRPACSQFHMIMAPFSDIHYRHHEYDLEYSKSEEREIRVQSSSFAILAAFRSWPGFITLYQPQDHTLKTLIDLLRLPNESTRQVILDFLYDLLRIQVGTSYSDYDKALLERANMKPSDPDAWRLHEGFVVAEAKVLLPHIAKFRPNLIQNYFSLILYTLIKKDLLSSLCKVIVTSSQTVSIKATILLGELLHLVDKNLPDCGMMSHALPILCEKAAGIDSEQRLKASQAITALLQLSRIQLSRIGTKGMSLYLRNILEINKEEGTGAKVISTASDPAKISKWLGKDHDDLIQQTLKDSGVFTESSVNWKWNLLIPVLRWPSSTLVSLEDAIYRSFIKKLLNHFKPSSKLFSRVDATHSSALAQAEALVVFTEFLLNVSSEDQDRFLNDLLGNINSALKNVVCEMPFHDSYLSPSHLNITVCQYYFLAIGNLTRFPKGYDLILKAGIYDQMMAVIHKSVSDMYAKLFVSTLDYSINGLNRTILSKILTSSKDCSRMYATQMLRILVRARARDFTRWGIELLVGQLYDESKLVALAALDVLDEALDDEEYLEAVLKNPPSAQHLGDNGQLLLAKLVASPQGFRTYHDCNFISPLLDKWANTFNMKYVKLMQTALAESLTQLQRGEDGLYGRRTGSKHVVHDVFVLPHLYGSLTLHKEGFALLIQHENLANLIETVREGITSNLQEVFKLKSAIWALGHLGRSSNGVHFLNSENIISCFVQLAANCPVYSVRGTIFHAICLIATTWDGVNLLQKYGWESVRRHHHEQLQLYVAQENFGDKEIASMTRKTPNQPSESDGDDPEATKAGFYFMDESEDETESFPLLMDELDADSAAARKSQTLPHDSKPPSYMGHQRSFSDCAPVIEELSGGTQHPSSQELTLSKRSTQLKNKILSSFRRKSAKRRDSVGSRTSNSSSASEKVLSFLHPSRRRKRGRSFGSSGREDDIDSSHSQSCTDEELMAEDNVSHEIQRTTRLSPIASGASLTTGDHLKESMESSSRRRKVSNRDNNLAYSHGEKKNYPTLSPPHHSSITNYGFHKLRALALHRRGVSESSHEELQSKNSLRDFLSSSYDQSSHAFTRGMVRSPSGCSELSSVRSFGALGPRGGSSNWLMGRGREGNYVPNFDDDPNLHPSGQCYLGLAVPLDIDMLLLDPSYGRSKEVNKEKKERFSMTSEFVWEEFEGKGDRKKSLFEKKMRMSMDENEALEFHNTETCLGCYSFSRLDEPQNGLEEENIGPEKIVQESLPSRKLKENKNKSNNKVSEVSQPSTVASHRCDDTSTSKSLNDPMQNRYLARKEILRFVNNLTTSFIAKSCESGLLALKTRLSWAFQDPCLYAEICVLFSSYSFRLNARRFIQELFLDLAFKEVFEDARRILLSDEGMYEALNKKLKCDDEVTTRSFDATHHDIPEYNLNVFEGFDMGENC